MRVERRGRVILARFDGQPRMLRDEPVSEPKPDGKPFAISKRLVWEAWRRVKTNDGAEGVDEESIEEFERDLKDVMRCVTNAEGGVV